MKILGVAKFLSNRVKSRWLCSMFGCLHNLIQVNNYSNLYRYQWIISWVLTRFMDHLWTTLLILVSLNSSVNLNNQSTNKPISRGKHNTIKRAKNRHFTVKGKQGHTTPASQIADVLIFSSSPIPTKQSCDSRRSCDLWRQAREVSAWNGVIGNVGWFAVWLRVRQFDKIRVVLISSII